MKNKKLENAIEKAKDFYYFCYNSDMAPIVVSIGFYGMFAANGFYRGFNNMPAAPEHLSQLTFGDKFAVGTVGVLETSLIVDGLRSDRYSDGFRTVACFVGMPILAGLTHILGYTAGKALSN